MKRKAVGLAVPLAATSFSALSISYIFASSAGRHPYLLYSALAVPAVAAVSYIKALPIVNRLFELVSSSPAGGASAESDDEAPTTPVTVDGSPALSAVSDEAETSALDNSVYSHVTKSDYEDSEESSSKPVAESSAAAAESSTATLEKTAKQEPTVSTLSADVPVLVSKLARFGNITGTISGLAFLIATVGIFGDINK